MKFFRFLIGLVLFLTLVLMPTGIAVFRSHRNAFPIFLTQTIGALFFSILLSFLGVLLVAPYYRLAGLDRIIEPMFFVDSLQFLSVLTCWVICLIWSFSANVK